MARTLHWILASSVAAAWLTGRPAPGGLRHVVLGVLVALLLGSTVARVARARRLGPTRAAALSAAIGLGLLLVLAGTGALVLAGEERWAPSLVAVGTGVRAHAVHELAAWALVGWVGVHVAGALRHWARHRPPAGAEARAVLVALAITGSVALAPLPGPPATETYAGADPAWQAACGECHLAYPPELLPERSWSRMLDGSADHFGEDLALEARARATVRDWLVAHAAERDATEHAWRVHRSVPPGEAPQRVTELDWWARAHAAVPAEAVEHPDVRTPGRCQACHPDAAGGAFQAVPLRPGETP